MPLSKHFGGSGAKVMRSMRATYRGKKSPKEIERIFYATENARKMRKARGR